MSKYNYLIIGSGLYGATFAQQAHAAGKSVLVIDKRPHIAAHVLTLPLYADLSLDDVDRICEIIKN